MKIKNAEGNEVEITIKPLLGRHADQGFNMFVHLEKDGEVAPDKLIDYMGFLDKLACELSGLTKEQLNNFPEEEKQKIICYFQNKIEGKVNFLKSSLKQADSVPQDIPK